MKRLFGLAVFAALLGASSGAFGQNAFERLVMPGKLIEGHAKYEKDCGTCHKPFEKGSQDKLCLDCHKKVAEDVAAKSGMHGRRPDIAARSCSHCHADHKGRDARIAAFDHATFDHLLTDFALRGAHGSVMCGNCHKPERRFRDTPQLCNDCHKAADPHRGRLGESCQNCHDENSWRKTKPYDHDKTDFKLAGAHRQAACNACHFGQVWKGAPKECVDCHKSRDKHQGRNGPKCGSCHKSTNWRDVTFLHNRDTKFPLLGKHARAKCESCHKKEPKAEKLAVTCMPCHAKQDVHKGNLGKECQTCHNESGWRIGAIIDHDKDTRFALAGRHAVVKCGECHKSSDYREAPRTCIGCHEKKDEHAGRFGPKCESCHSTSTWKRARYDHGRQANWPLTGRHAEISCYACHQQKHLKTIELARGCIGCHKSDDRHRGAFGTDCARCHGTSTFRTAIIPRR